MTEIFEALRARVGQTVSDGPVPFMRWLSPEVVAVEEGRLTYRIVLREEMLNGMGTLHGGVSAAMIDDIVGTVVLTLPDPVFYVSLNLSVDYLGPARAGEAVIVHGYLIKKGRRHVLGVGEVWNADESRMLVRGTVHLVPREARG